MYLEERKQVQEINAESDDPVIVRPSELRLLHKDSLGDSITKIHTTQVWSPHRSADMLWERVHFLENPKPGDLPQKPSSTHDV